MQLSYTDDGLELDATAIIDQREFGMTWSPLQIVRGPATATVHALLRPR